MYWCIEHTYDYYNCPSILGLSAAMGQNDVVLPPPLILMETVRGVVHFATVPQQQPQSQMPYQAYASYAVGSPEASFFSELSFPDVLQGTTSSTSLSVVQIGTLPQFLDQWRNTSSNWFVLNMVKDHCLQLSCQCVLLLLLLLLVIFVSDFRFLLFTTFCQV